jgi:uncharacterized protein
MKYVLLAVILLVAFSIWNRSRSSRTDAPDQKPTTPAQPQPMLACLQCGVHMPEQEAVRGRRGAYCSDAHRRLSGDQPQG